jgi:hypothetical protein
MNRENWVHAFALALLRSPLGVRVNAFSIAAPGLALNAVRFIGFLFGGWYAPLSIIAWRFLERLGRGICNRLLDGLAFIS